MSQPPDILYCIEHVARELNIASAVRAMARAQHGLNVHVHVLFTELDPIFERHRPTVITVPYCSSRRFAPRDVLGQLPEVPVVNLACEQLLSRANRRIRLPKDDLTRNHVLHIAAGDFFRQWLLEAGVAPANVKVLGSPNYQLYREPYRSFFASRRHELAAAHGLDPNLRWVFLPENFGAAFFTAAQKRKRIRSGYERRELAAYVRFAQQSFREISSWCCEAAATGKIEMIVRPRPAIAKSLFTEKFFKTSRTQPQPHLHFIKDGIVQEWILTSQLVVSSFSTTLIEAAAARTPACLLAPVAIPESASSEWQALIPKVENKHDFLKWACEPDAAPLASELEQWADENLLGYGDAIANISDFLAEICAGGIAPPKPTWTVPRQSARSVIQQRVKELEIAIRQRLRPNRRPVFGHECDVISRQSIDHCANQWAELISARAA